MRSACKIWKAPKCFSYAADLLHIEYLLERQGNRQCHTRKGTTSFNIYPFETTHVACMGDGCIPKDLLYGKLVKGVRPLRRPNLRFKYICKWDMKALNISTVTSEDMTANCDAWKYTIQVDLNSYEALLWQKSETERFQRKSRRQSNPQPSTFVCNKCLKDWYLPIGLTSNKRRCKLRPWSMSFWMKRVPINGYWKQQNAFLLYQLLTSLIYS